LTDSAAKSSWVLFSAIISQQILTALAFPIAKLGLNEIDPLVFAFFRFSITILIYLPVLIVLRKKPLMPVRDHLRAFLIGLILIPFNQVLFLIGQSMTSASHGSLLFATIPIFVYMFAIIILKERPKLRRGIGIAVALVGVYLILAGGKIDFGGGHLMGDLLILVAVVAWATGTVLGKPLALKYGAFRATGLALVYGSAVYLPYGLYRAYNADYSAVTATGWFSVLYLALIVSVLCYFLWYWVIKYMEVSRAAVLQNIQPILATAVAAVVLSEPVTVYIVVGGLIVISGVILTEI
jgi:drug/metabolite transporter (DMT)-like permease